MRKYFFNISLRIKNDRFFMLVLLITIDMFCACFSSYGQIAAKDTVFLYKDKVLGSAQCTYIENNRKSELYNGLSSWKYAGPEKETFDYSLAYLKKNNLLLTKKELPLSVHRWISLERYKGNFYAYYPCDFMGHYKASINDTAFIDWAGEGPVANKILTQKKINANTFVFNLTNVYQKHRKLIIHLIDKKKGIAIFEELTNKKDKRYYFMIAADKIRAVPLIVNHSEQIKLPEFQFDEPPSEADLPKP